MYYIIHPSFSKRMYKNLLLDKCTKSVDSDQTLHCLRIHSVMNIYPNIISIM